MATNRYEKFWDGAAPRYDRIEERFEKIHGRTVELTHKYLQPDHVALDFGCGTGNKALALAKHVHKMIAIDISTKMLDIARTKATRSDCENVEFRHGTLFDEALETESFDVIMAFNVLHALDDRQKTVRRIIDLLKPGGIFVSTTPCLREKKTLPTTFRMAFFNLAGLAGLLPKGFTRLRFQDVEALIGNADLRIVEQEILVEHMSTCYIVAEKT